jgi:hypothetical protein
MSCPVHAGPEGQFGAGSFDSLSAVELSNGIAAALNLQLPGTLVFDYPSVKAIAAHVHGLMAPAASLATTGDVTAASLVNAMPDAPRARSLIKVAACPSHNQLCLFLYGIAHMRLHSSRHWKSHCERM